jgi:hypothetical protein
LRADGAEPAQKTLEFLRSESRLGAVDTERNLGPVIGQRVFYLWYLSGHGFDPVENWGHYSEPKTVSRKLQWPSCENGGANFAP